VKVFGDDFDELGETAGKIARILRGIRGAADVKVEQSTGLHLLDVKLDKPTIARLGLNVADVTRRGLDRYRREAGLVFQGDRRFHIVVRLPDRLREDLSVLENLPLPLPRDGSTESQTSLVTTINHLRLRGENGEQAIVDGALTRLRPVLMTALVAALGFVPMAIATGTGAEVQKPLATVAIGGLMTATLLTLVVLPALYKRYALTDATLREITSKEREFAA